MKYKMNRLSGLTILSENLLQANLPIKTLYKFTKLFKRAEEEYSQYSSLFNQLLTKYAVIDEEGHYDYADNGEIKIREGMIDECRAAFNDLSSIEVDLPDVSFTLDELENLQLSMAQMTVLMDFIEE